MTEKIRMLKARMASAGSVRQEIDVMLEIAAELRHDDPLQAMEFAQAASERSIQAEFSESPYLKGVAGSFLLLGLLNTELGNYDLSLSYLFNALSSFEELNDPQRLAETLDGIALIYSRLGAYQEALHYYEQELPLVKLAGDKKAAAGLLSRIGKVEAFWGDSSKALNTLHQALTLYEDLEDIRGQAEVLGTGASASMRTEDYAEARVSIEKSAALYQQLGLERDKAGALNTLGEILTELGDYEQALAHLESSLGLAQKDDLRYEAAHSIFLTGCIYLKQDEPAEAETQFQAGLEIAEEIGAKQLCARFHHQMGEVFKRRGDFQAALGHYEQFHHLQEDVFNAAAAGQLRNMEIAFRAETSRQELQVYRQKTAAFKEEIAERKRIEDDLRAANQQLRQEIVEREHLISDLDSFSYMVAHDLKNPLQVVLFGSQMLLETLEGTLDEESAISLQNILQMGHKMRAIIDELLVLASVRQQEITLRPLDMSGLIEDVKARLKPLMEETGAQIILPEKWPPALGHAPWVEEVWTNYISNGIKYGGRPPRVELGATLQSDGYIRFWVRDNGLGLQEKIKDGLFTPFKRFSKVQATGHGLGLSIVKRIVEKLGGEVRAESEGNGQGSVFSFTLIDATPFAAPQLKNEFSEEALPSELD